MYAFPYILTSNCLRCKNSKSTSRKLGMTLCTAPSKAPSSRTLNGERRTNLWLMSSSMYQPKRAAWPHSRRPTRDQNYPNAAMTTEMIWKWRHSPLNWTLNHWGYMFKFWTGYLCRVYIAVWFMYASVHSIEGPFWAGHHITEFPYTFIYILCEYIGLWILILFQ